MSEKLFKVKKRGEYLWPCKNDQSRKLMVFESDILYRTSPGVFDMTTGLYKKNVHIPEEDIEERNIDLEKFQKNVVKVIYKNFNYEIKSLKETFNTDDPETMKKVLQKNIIVGDDFINIIIDVNSLAYGLKLLDDLNIPLFLRNLTIENIVSMYKDID